MKFLRDNVLAIAVVVILACVVANTVYHIVTGR